MVPIVMDIGCRVRGHFLTKKMGIAKPLATKEDQDFWVSQICSRWETFPTLSSSNVGKAIGNICSTPVGISIPVERSPMTCDAPPLNFPQFVSLLAKFRRSCHHISPFISIVFIFMDMLNFAMVHTLFYLYIS